MPEQDIWEAGRGAPLRYIAVKKELCKAVR